MTFPRTEYTMKLSLIILPAVLLAIWLFNSYRLGRFRNSGKYFSRTKIFLFGAILFGILAFFTFNPIVTGGEKLSAEYIRAVESQSKGLYSHKLPLVPLFVSIDYVKEDRVFYTIHYLPFGSVEMSYSEADGYNTEKQLSPLS